MLKCDYCGKIIEHVRKSAICVDCGHIMKLYEIEEGGILNDEEITEENEILNDEEIINKE